MAITTLDGALAGMQATQPFFKNTGSMEAAGVYHSLWYAQGNPAAAAANAAGVNGAAVSGVVAGRIFRNNPSSGNAYIARLAAAAGSAGQLLLIDRLWHNSGLSVTSTTAQAITPATLPARDNNASTNGDGVMAAIEWSANGGAGTPTVTLTYTDQDGNTGATGAFAGVTTPNAGTWEMFPLASGDTGVRAPTSFIQSATRTSGTMHLVLFRILKVINCPGTGLGGDVDVLTGGRPRIYDDSVLQLIWLPSSATSTFVTGEYVETHG